MFLPSYCLSFTLQFSEGATGGVLQEKVFLEFSQNPQENMWQSLVFNKVADLRPATLLEKRLWHWCFYVNFAKFLRTSFLQNSYRRLLLNFKDFH